MIHFTRAAVAVSCLILTDMTSAGVNPTSTIGALALTAADGI